MTMSQRRRRVIAASALSLSLAVSSAAAAAVEERSGSFSGGLIPAEEAEVEAEAVAVAVGDAAVENAVDPSLFDDAAPSSPRGPLRRRLPSDGGGEEQVVAASDGHHDMSNIFTGKSARHQSYCAKFASEDRTPEPLAPRRASLANATESYSSALARSGGLRSASSASAGGSAFSEYGRPGGSSTCSGGQAAGYPCKKVDLQSLVTLFELNYSIRPNDNSPGANDIWGWTDASSGREFALIGMSQGVAIVEVTDPQNPVYFGGIEGANNGAESMWRDIKVYNDHALLVSEADGHGMQVFDMTRLLSLNSNQIPRQFSVDAWYREFGNAHNIAINEQSGYAYAVGTNRCSGGLHIINVQSPKNPWYAGCYSGDGYTHDVQCVNYDGPDTSYNNREICFACNEDTVTIVDVTSKSSPYMISKESYGEKEYTHQGWLTEDKTTFIFGDEGDETDGGVRTRTYVMDVTNLDNPFVTSNYTNPQTEAIDHNQYVRGQYSYQANYDAGLRVMDVSNARNGQIQEVGYFDIVPSSNRARFNGAWSVYPYFPSGTVVVSGTNQGMYVLQPDVLKNSGGQNGGGGQESVLYRDSFELDGEGMSKARRVTRIPKPSRLNNDEGIGDYVGRAIIPEFGKKRMFGAVLNREDWVDVSLGAGMVKCEAKFALANQRRGRLLVQCVLQYDNNRWAAGEPLALGNLAHERWAEYSSDIKVVRNARKVKRVAMRVKNVADTGAPKQVVYVAGVVMKRSA